MAGLFGSKGVWENGITFVRIAVGWMIFRYGLELFHIQDLLNFLIGEKFPFPVFSGYAAKIIELAGGILLILGLFTRWITPLLMITMWGVIYTTAHGNIFEADTTNKMSLTGHEGEKSVCLEKMEYCNCIILICSLRFNRRAILKKQRACF